MERRAQLGYSYKTDKLLKKIDSILEQGKMTFAGGRDANAKALAQFMYKTNFLTARKDTGNGEIVRKYFEENRYISGQFADFGFDWEIHPAYRWARQPDSQAGVLNVIDQSADDN